MSPRPSNTKLSFIMWSKPFYMQTARQYTSYSENDHWIGKRRSADWDHMADCNHRHPEEVMNSRHFTLNDYGKLASPTVQLQIINQQILSDGYFEVLDPAARLRFWQQWRRKSIVSHPSGPKKSPSWVVVCTFIDYVTEMRAFCLPKKKVPPLHQLRQQLPY